MRMLFDFRVVPRFNDDNPTNSATPSLLTGRVACGVTQLQE